MILTPVTHTVTRIIKIQDVAQKHCPPRVKISMVRLLQAYADEEAEKDPPPCSPATVVGRATPRSAPSRGSGNGNDSSNVGQFGGGRAFGSGEQAGDVSAAELLVAAAARGDGFAHQTPGSGGGNANGVGGVITGSQQQALFR